MVFRFSYLNWRSFPPSVAELDTMCEVKSKLVHCHIDLSSQLALGFPQKTENSSK